MGFMQAMVVELGRGKHKENKIKARGKEISCLTLTAMAGPFQEYLRHNFRNPYQPQEG
jgi:DNA-binding protein